MENLRQCNSTSEKLVSEREKLYPGKIETGYGSEKGCMTTE